MSDVDLLETLRELADQERKLADQQAKLIEVLSKPVEKKDRWDKFGAISAFLSTVIIGSSGNSGEGRERTTAAGPLYLEVARLQERRPPLSRGECTALLGEWEGYSIGTAHRVETAAGTT